MLAGRRPSTTTPPEAQLIGDEKPSDRAAVRVRPVAEVNGEFLAETTTCGDPHDRCEPDEFRGHQDLQVCCPGVDAAVWRQVLAFDVGVDRHLGNLASTNRRDEVDGHGAATFGEKLLGPGRDVDVHT